MDVVSIIGAISGLVSLAGVIYGFGFRLGRLQEKLDIVWDIIWDRLLRSDGGDDALASRVSDGLSPDIRWRLSRQNPSRADLKKIADIAKKENLPIEQVISIVLNYTRKS